MPTAQPPIRIRKRDRKPARPILNQYGGGSSSVLVSRAGLLVARKKNQHRNLTVPNSRTRSIMEKREDIVDKSVRILSGFNADGRNVKRGGSDPSEEYKRQLTFFHNELVEHLEKSCRRKVMSIVLERPTDENGALPLSDIRRNIRRVAALLQQQAPDLYIGKRQRQRLFEDEESDDDSRASTPLNIDVFITDKLGLPLPDETPSVTPRLPEVIIKEHVVARGPPPPPSNSRMEPTRHSLPKLPKHKMANYDNVRSSLDTKGAVRRSTEKKDFVHKGSKPKFDDLRGTYSSQPGSLHQSNAPKNFVKNDPYRPNAKSKLPERTELPKLPDPERLKNLVSRDFSKPPEKRPDPRVQQLAKPMSPVKKVDVFKMQQKVKLNHSMDNMMNMTNYGEADKPNIYDSKPKVKPAEEEKPKQPFKLPKELQRALPKPKPLPAIAKPKPPTPDPPDPTPEASPSPSPSPTPTPVLPEPSFMIVKDEFSSDEEEEEDITPPVTDSAYCTCDEFTESDDYKLLTSDDVDDDAKSSIHLEPCPNCGGKRSLQASRVPSRIKEQSFVFESRSSSGIGTEPDPEPTAESPPIPEPTPVISPEHVELVLSPEPPPPPPKPKKDILKALDNIGHYVPLRDPPPKPPSPVQVTRTVLAPLKKQKGVYKNGVKDAYLKALQAAEIRRLPHDWTMMLGPRISRSWVFSYFEYVKPPKIKDPDAPPSPPPPPPPPSYLQGTESKKKGKKKKKKKFKPMKHIFGKVKPDTYFPGMKNNPVLTPITVTETVPAEVATMMNQNPAAAAQRLAPLAEIPAGRGNSEEPELDFGAPEDEEMVPPNQQHTDYRLANRNASHSRQGDRSRQKSQDNLGLTYM